MDDSGSIDGWPSKQLGTVAQVHALGQITLVYNYLQEAFTLLFTLCMPTRSDFSEALFHKLNNRDRINLLYAVIDKNEMEEDVREALHYGLLCYDVCTENRNILMHTLRRDCHLSR
jgi:hypothetical protein